MGSASSDVARNTATSVPAETKPPLNSCAHAAEKPHCGMQPAAAPSSGPNRPARRTAPTSLSAARCSRYSIKKTVTSRKGVSFAQSISASSSTSHSRSMDHNTPYR